MIEAMRSRRRRDRLWVVETLAGRQVRRMLLDAETGELLDHVWIDGQGRTRSWSAVAPAEVGTPAVRGVGDLDRQGRADERQPPRRGGRRAGEVSGLEALAIERGRLAVAGGTVAA